ncbi:MAG: YggS family pyridoxal phosphate-dependent enzyme [Polyangiaceae bacterium]|nr:YggS family pyridoxal phosphate-dependent enzyme [Polyangiaceae bacterium]
MSTIAEALAHVRDRIARAAIACSRNPEDIKLIAVSKTKPETAVREAYKAGQRAFGENYAQELAQKADHLTDLADIEWHYIGHLQSNKAKYVARAAHVLHALDSPSLVRELGKRLAQKDENGNMRGPLPVLIEVNVGAEPQKHGVSPANLGPLLEAVDHEPTLKLRGLMTMPPQDLENARRAFEALVSLRNLHGGQTRLPELSMGMSEDLEIAIACGATMVRVGSAIFGARE